MQHSYLDQLLKILIKKLPSVEIITKKEVVSMIFGIMLQKSCLVNKSDSYNLKLPKKRRL